MNAEFWSAFAAMASVVTAVIVAYGQWRRERRQRAFDLYQEYKTLATVRDGACDVTMGNNVRALNLLHLTARLVQKRHIDRSVCIDLFGRTYIQLVNQIKGLAELGPRENRMPGSEVLNLPQYSVILKVERSFHDTIVSKEHHYVEF